MIRCLRVAPGTAAEKPESNGKPDPKAKSDKGKAGKDKTENATPAWVAKRRLVKVGYSDANYVEVNSGLEEGDRVVIGLNDAAEVAIEDAVSGEALGQTSKRGLDRITANNRLRSLIENRLAGLGLASAMAPPAPRTFKNVRRLVVIVRAPLGPK